MAQALTVIPGESRATPEVESDNFSDMGGPDTFFTIEDFVWFNAIRSADGAIYLQDGSAERGRSPAPALARRSRMQSRLRVMADRADLT